MEKEQKDYDPNGLLNEAMRLHSLKNDVALAAHLEVATPVISKTRHFRLPVGPNLILRLHERCGMPVSTIRSFIGGQV